MRSPFHPSSPSSTRLDNVPIMMQKAFMMRKITLRDTLGGVGGFAEGRRITINGSKLSKNLLAKGLPSPLQHLSRFRTTLVAAAVLAVALLGCSGIVTPDPESTLVDSTLEAGKDWSLVRTGGGFVAPTGRTGLPLRGVAFGNGRFVAVGGDGTIVHSSDGDSWQQATNNATSNWLLGVAFGNGRFVAVGFDGTIVHSSDGDSWQQPPTRRPRNRSVASPSATGASSRSGRHDRPQQRRRLLMRGVAFGNGRFVAVGGARSSTAVMETPAPRTGSMASPSATGASSRSAVTARSSTAATETPGSTPPTAPPRNRS